MGFYWSYSGVKILILFAIDIEVIAAPTPPVIDLGYALHQATISPVKPTQRTQKNSHTDFHRKIQPISNSPTSDMQPLPSEPCDSHPHSPH
jgi:hypothetical protein